MKERKEIGSGLSARMAGRKRFRKGRHSLYTVDIETFLSHMRGEMSNWLHQIDAAVERVIASELDNRCVALIVEAYDDEGRPTKKRFCSEPACRVFTPWADSDLEHKHWSGLASVPLCAGHGRHLFKEVLKGYRGRPDEDEEVVKTEFFRRMYKQFESEHGTKVARLVLSNFKTAIKKLYKDQYKYSEEYVAAQERTQDDLTGDGSEVDGSVR